MFEPPLAPCEAERIASLHRLALLDSPAEERFDRITRIAALALEVPIALISLVDVDRQWFKSRYGMEIAQTPRSTSFCGHAILAEDLFVVSDATEDLRFCDNPLVTGEPYARFYAGYPLDDGAGQKLGTLCVLDRRSRTLTAAQADLLRELGTWVERELRAVIRLDDQLSDLAPIGLFRTDESGRCVYVNRRWTEITGLSRDESLGTGWATGLHPDDAEWVFAHWSLAAADGRQHEVEFRFRALDGRITWVNARVTPRRDDAGTLIGYLGVLNDITGQRSAETALRASETIHRSVVESLSEGIIIQDHLGQVLGCNPAAERILGLPLDDLGGWITPGPTWSMINEHGNPLLAEQHPHAVSLRTGRPCWNVVVGIRSPAGELRWLSINSQPLSWDGGPVPWGVTCTFADVTDLRPAERRIARPEPPAEPAGRPGPRPGAGLRQGRAAASM